MAEYIERRALLKKAIEEKRFAFQMNDLINSEVVIKTVYKDLAEFINSIPAADVAPVVHGRWDDGFDNITPYCSVCGMANYVMRRTPNYCPNCGARMDGE